MRALSAVLFGCILIFSAGCTKKESGCQPVPVSQERQKLIDYCQTNNISYTEHTSGLFYQIINPGTGNAPTNSSVVSVVYTGKHLDNTIFDATANAVELNLANVIDGWRVGVPLLKKGGRILLVVPSAMAYSCTGSLPVIQPNEPLVFDVTLTDVK